jgi:pilus assembly protein CpaE
VIAAAQAEQPLVITMPLNEAAHYMAQHGISPSHVVVDIGSRQDQALSDIDALAQHCEAGTRVVAVGDTNDIQLYRALLQRGVLDYLPMPAEPADVVRTLRQAGGASSPAVTASASANKRVIVFMSGASGDGGSTVALNTAYAISQTAQGATVFVDMDYQFGMAAKYLSLQNQYGIRDLFDHPERGVDATLIKRMVAVHGKLHVITAPSELRYLPLVQAETIRALIATLKQSYDTIIIDLPHVWLPWVAAAAQQSTQLVLVAQLWLKSVSHASRLKRVLRDMGVGAERVTAVINRSGARFKEAIDTKDFERVCGIPVRYTVSNDIKSVVAGENSAKTIMELPPSDIAADILTLARGLMGEQTTGGGLDKRGGLLSRLKG